jgi:uncharacterized protein involved in exopolysaccharide biosynthesis
MATIAAPEPQLTVWDYLRPAWRQRWAILLLVLLATAGTYVYYEHQPARYSTSTELYVQSAAGIPGSGTGATTPQSEERSVLDIATLTKSFAVASRAAKEMGSSTPATVLAGEVQAAPVTGSDFLTITAHGGSAVETAAVADAFAHALIAMQSSESIAQLHSAISATEHSLKTFSSRQTASQRGALQLQLQQLRLQLSVPSLQIKQISPAPRPTLPEAPRPKRNAAFAFVLALLLGVVVAYLLASRQNSLATSVR